jgi:putative ABC transport system permease protein
MLKNYFRIAFRNLWRHKEFSIINILGLSVGMTACLLIFLYVSFELSYDTYHNKADRIYRLVVDIKTPTELLKVAGTSAPMGINLKADFPEVESVVRGGYLNLLVKRDKLQFSEDNVLFADPALFSVFSFPLMKGDPNTVLEAPYSIVLSEKGARKYFGKEDPIGQSLILNEKEIATVTGVMKDIPGNSNFKADIIISMTTMTQKLFPGLDEQWGNFIGFTYLLLGKGVNTSHLQAKFPEFMQRHAGKVMEQWKMNYALSLEPLKDVYLRSERGAPEKGSMANIYIFSFVAVFILLIACINFVNLTTARATERAKEVGVRKVMGAHRGQLALQFMGESVLISFIAFLMAIVMSALLLPLFNQLAGKAIGQYLFIHTYALCAFSLAALIIGLLAGVYPALLLSGFKPVAVLKGKFSAGKQGISLRKGLVITQFTIAIILITGTIVVYNQLSYMRNQQLGFKKEQMLVIDLQRNEWVNKYEVFKREFAGVKGVLSASFSSSIPGGDNAGAFTEIENTSGELQGANLDLYAVDHDFLSQFQIGIIAGRTFSRDFVTDSTTALIVNEAAVASFGYKSPADIIGKKFSQWGRKGTIIGVVNNFNFRSLQNEIKPLTMRIAPDDFKFLSLNLAAGNIPTTMARIEEKWKELNADRPFNYQFADDTFNSQYVGEERFGKLFLYFAILAILISCIGLLGLASYSTFQRTREIGIRKVLGASVGSVIGLLSKEFIRLVIIALAIACPIAWFIMTRWLQDFAYRTPIGWGVFATAGLLAILVAVCTVSFQAMKAAVANPIRSLKSE